MPNPASTSRRPEAEAQQNGEWSLPRGCGVWSGIVASFRVLGCAWVLLRVW